MNIAPAKKPVGDAGGEICGVPRHPLAAVESIKDLIGVLDVNGVVVAANRSWREFAAANGLTEGMTVGANYLLACNTAMAEGIRNVLTGRQEEFSLEMTCTTAGRKCCFLRQVFSLGGLESGRILLLFENIAERKCTEKESQRREYWLIESPQRGRIGKYALDIDSGLWASSAVLDEILGIERNSEKTLARWNALVHPEERQAMLEYFWRVVAQKRPFNKEYRIVRPSDGTIRWLWGRGELKFDCNGRPIRMIGTIQDITEWVQAEDRVQKLARAVEQSPVSIVITDRSGNIEFVNPKFSQVTGYSQQEVLGQNPRILKSGEMPAEGYRQLWESIIAGNEWRGEFHNRRKDGTFYWEKAAISPIRDQRGEITHFLAIKEDVTERKQLESRFLRNQRMEAIGSLASGIAHDLNNVLAPILVCAPMLISQELMPAERRELAVLIEESARRAAGVVKQMLSFGRGKDVPKAALQFRHIVREMGRLVDETFPRSIRFEFKCSRDLWPVHGDGTQLYQVLLNLFVNARDAMPSGGRITVCADNVQLAKDFAAEHPELTVGTYVRVQVTDTGTGIPESIQDQIFSPYFTTKPAGQGTGLGLAAVQSIIKDHGGFITLRSQMGQGTTFEFYLRALPETILPDDQKGGADAVPEGHGELVLLVDDELGINNAYKLVLQNHGYEVWQAANGIAALAQFTGVAQRVKLVVVDLLMPDMDGVTLCRALRSMSPGIPIVVSSGGLIGLAGTEYLRALQEIGVEHILYKPHTAEALLRQIDQALVA